MDFIIEHWPSISAILGAILLRLIPTEKNYDIISKILKLLDLVIPNLKKGGGKHIAKIILFFALAFVSAESFAQLNTRTRQIRFATGVYQASDTAETAANAGRVWYDFVTQRYRANFAGVNGFFGEGSPASITGTATVIPYFSALGALVTNNTDVTFDDVTNSFTVANGFFTTASIGGATSLGISNTGLAKYSADLSGTFDNRSLIDKGFADGAYWKVIGSTSITGDVTIDQPGTIVNFQSGDGLGAGGQFLLTNNETGESVYFGLVGSGDSGGLKYSADYSASYSSRSLVDKAYADTKIDGTMSANTIPFGIDANSLTQNSDVKVYTAGAGNYGINIDNVHLGYGYIDQAQTSVIRGITNDISTPSQGLSIYNVEGNVGNVTPGILTVYGGSAYTVGNNDGGSVKIQSGNKNGTGQNGNVYISGGSVTTGTNGGWVVIQNLPTVSPCATAPAGTLWSNANVLTVCP